MVDADVYQVGHRAAQVHAQWDSDQCIFHVSAAGAVSDSCLMDCRSGRVNSLGRELCAGEVRHADLWPV